MAGRRAGQSDRSGAGDVDDRARSDARRDRAVIAGGEDVGEQREIVDLRHGSRLVGELQQIEIGVRHHDVLRLAADPAAHVDVAVGRAGPRRIDVQADAGLAFLAVAAAPAGDVEGHRNQIADFDELHVAPGFDDLAGDLVAEHQPVRRGGAAADHVLVAAADVGGDDFENDAVLAFARAQREFRKVDGLYLHLARSHISDSAVRSHRTLSSLTEIDW